MSEWSMVPGPPSARTCGGRRHGHIVTSPLPHSRGGVRYKERDKRLIQLAFVGIIYDFIHPLPWWSQFCSGFGGYLDVKSLTLHIRCNITYTMLSISMICYYVKGLRNNIQNVQLFPSIFSIFRPMIMIMFPRCPWCCCPPCWCWWRPWPAWRPRPPAATGDMTPTLTASSRSELVLTCANYSAI